MALRTKFKFKLGDKVNIFGNEWTYDGFYTGVTPTTQWAQFRFSHKNGAQINLAVKDLQILYLFDIYPEDFEGYSNTTTLRKPIDALPNKE